MNDTGSIQKQLDLLLSAYGYNLYQKENRMRADDLLVRQRAGALLSESATHLTQLAADYAHLFIPPATREQPFPPAEHLAQLRSIKALQSEVALLESRLRGMSAPTQDSVWRRFRSEATTLERLLTFDYHLVANAGILNEFVQTLSAADWTDEVATHLRVHLQNLETSARSREKFLTSPF